MPVSVDPLVRYGGSDSFRWKESCHLFCLPGEEAELHALATRIGLKREWFQTKTRLPHYDLTASKRRLAIQHGAQEVPSAREALRAYRNSKEQQQ